MRFIEKTGTSQAAVITDFQFLFRRRKISLKISECGSVGLNHIRGEVWAFYYPFGEHAEQYPSRTAMLKEQGLILQCGYGPTAYWRQSDGYLYVSRVLLSGHNLRHAGSVRAWQASERECYP